MSALRNLTISFLLAASAMASQASAQSARDFQLPPEPEERPDVQGPVDSDAPVVRPIPRRIPTPLPEREPEPIILPSQPTGDEAPAAPRSGAEARSSSTGVGPATPSRPAPAQAQPGAVSRSETIEEPANGEPPLTQVPPAAAQSTDADLTEPSTVPVETATESGEPEDQTAWAWLILLAVGLVGAAITVILMRRRRSGPIVPTVERPNISGSGANGSPPPHPLSVRIEAVKLTRSFMNATLDYRVIVRNRTDAALTDVSLAARLVPAHNALPVEEQIADNHTDLPRTHAIERLSPGQSRTIEGKLTLPVNTIQPIRQGNAALFVPILQVRADNDEHGPVVRNTVVGQVSASGSDRLLPFRLDEGPRSYAPLSQRGLD